MSESKTCRHELVHIYNRHECDGCCARYILEPIKQKRLESISLSDTLEVESEENDERQSE
jgi:hypothetical protein